MSEEPDNPSIQAARRRNQKAVSVFGCDTWSLDALLESQEDMSQNLGFDAWPSGFRRSAKVLAYLMINKGNPSSLVEAPDSNYAQWPTPGTIRSVLFQLRQEVDWLVNVWSAENPDTPVLELADLDSGHLEECFRRISTSNNKSDTKARKLERFVRAWHFNSWLPPEHQWPKPPWVDVHRKTKPPFQENRTKRISQATMAPLLEWSLAFIDLFADDIFCAQQQFDARMQAARPLNNSQVFAREILQDLSGSGVALPRDPSVKGAKREGDVGWACLSYRYGVSAGAFAQVFHRKFRGMAVSRESPLLQMDFISSAQFHGSPWCRRFEIYDFTPRHSGPFAVERG